MRYFCIVIFFACVVKTVLATDNQVVNVSDPFVVFDPATINADIYVVGNGKVINNIFGGTSLNIGQCSNGDLNHANFSTMGTIRAVGIMHVYSGSTFTVNYDISGVTNSFNIDQDATVIFNAPLTGVGGIFNNNGNVHLAVNGCLGMTGIATNGVSGILTFNHDVSNAKNIINNGLISINNSITNTGNISNNGLINITNIINGAGNINNASGGVINLMTGANIKNTLNNAAGGILNVDGGNAAVIKNAGIVNIRSAFYGSGHINNNGVLNLSADIMMPSHDFNNYGTININGSRSMSVANYISSGVNNFTITNANIFDSLSVSGVIDITNGSIINIATDFIGLDNTLYSWTILSADHINYDKSTIINPISTSHMQSWKAVVTDQELQLMYNRKSFSETCSVNNNTQVTSVLDQLSTQNTHDSLLRAIASCSCQTEYDKSINSLYPAILKNMQRVSLQNITFNKVESRVSNALNPGLRMPFGMAYGDINKNTAVWGSWFGSLANQKAFSNTVGYHSTSSGGIGGIDCITDSSSIYGIALGVSNSNIHQTTDDKLVNRVLGYHAILYGSSDIITENQFLEWLITGISNKNKSTRYANIGGQNFGINSSYRTAQGGARVNVGECIGNDYWEFALIQTLRYTLLYQEEYDEQNNIAALHVTPEKYYNLLTVGGGFRILLPHADRWEVGPREIRVMGTYDAISPNQVVAANFINSSPVFSVSNSSARWGVEIGASYTYTFCDRLQLQLNYDFELRTKYTDNSAEVKVRFLF